MAERQRDNKGHYIGAPNPVLARELSRAEVNQVGQELPPASPSDREEQLRAAATAVLEWLGELEPQWRERIEVAQIERHWDKLQCLAQLAAYTLDQGAHLVVPPHPAFAPGYVPAGSETICPHCGETFRLRYPGQPYCSNRCADQARARAQELGQVPVDIARNN